VVWIFALLHLLAWPQTAATILVIAAALWTTWASFASAGRVKDRFLLSVLVLALGGATAAGLARRDVLGRDDDYWRAEAQSRLDAAETTCTRALESLVTEARRRADVALADSLSLNELAAPIDFLGRGLEVGVSRWRGEDLVDWVGSVTGPQRLEATDRPLLVDHNFRRYLTVSARGDPQEAGSGEPLVVRVDVSMGLRGDFFADVGVWPDPAAPLREATGVEVEVVADPAGTDSGSFDRWFGVGPDDPWVWVGLRQPRLESERDREAGGLARLASWLLGIALLAGLLRAWRGWPHPESPLARAALATMAVGLLFALRWMAEDADLATHLLQGWVAPFSLLRDEAYFTSLHLDGWLRSAADFAISATTVALAAVVLVPSWLRFVQPPAPPWRRVLSGSILVVASPALLQAVIGLQTIVAQGANPTLVGLRAPFFSLAFLTLHVAMMLTLLPWAVWILLGWDRWLRQGGRLALLPCLLSCGLSVALLLAQSVGPTRAAWAALLPLLGWMLRPALREQGFSRRLVVVLFTMIWFAGVQSQGLQDFYTRDRQQVAEERAVGRLRPDDPWRPYLLEDVLRRLSTDPEAMQRLTDPARSRDNLAFELWLTTELSRQGSPSCSIELLADDGEVVSRFDFGLPYESSTQRVLGNTELPRSGLLRMGTLEIGTDRGRFLIYRGILDLGEAQPGADLARLQVDLPYAALDPTSAEGDFRGVMESLGLPDARPFLPRQAFESGELVFASVDSSGVVVSSSPELLNLSGSQLPPPGSWRSLAVGGREYRLGQVRWGARRLAVAFAEPTATERILDASRLAMLYLLTGALLLGLLSLLVHVGVAPAERGGQLLGRAGFQERLLAAILLVVLLPVLVLGVVQERRGWETARQQGLAEVHQRLQTALNLLGSDLDRTTQALLRGDYVQQLVETGELSQWRDVGPFGRLELVIFSPDQKVLLDESLRDFTPAQARRFLSEVEGGRLYLESFANSWFVGRLYHLRGDDGKSYPVFARRRVVDADLARLARVVGADLTLFDGPWAVVSSQDYLLEAGLTVPVLPARAAHAIYDHGGRELVEAERQEGLVVARGYVGLDGPGTPRRGVLQARLFAQATESARAQQRARLFLLGLSSLALVVAVAVGLLLAGRIVDPIRNLVAATRRVGRGELDLHLPARGDDEIAELLRSFNRMTADLRTSQQQLAARRGFLEDMLGTLSVGVVVLDADARPTESNAAARDVLEGAQDAFLDRVRALGPPRELSEFEWGQQTERGPRTFRSVVTPTRLESGAAGWLVIVDDVTELLASRRLALYAQMARQVAHEVKNPLTPIQLSAQMVRQACEDGHPELGRIVDENVTRIESQVERLRQIASEFSLLGRDQLDDVAPVSLAPLLQEVAQAYPPRGQRPRVEVECPEDLVAVASPTGLLKILSNLVQNGLQAGGAQSTVHMSARSKGSTVEVEILDEGPGIPAEVADRLFEPYFSTKSTGTGLGLVVSRNLAEKMGGTLTVANRGDGEGARACLRLAVAPENSGTNPGRMS
jgi:signal transduction histidine kinase